MTTEFFVTGTDTNVGKTVVSALLATGMGAYYWKPIQSGTLESDDSQFVSQWIGSSRIVPPAYTFPQPLSPHAAAAVENVHISLETILKARPTLPQPLIVEGAGGVLVPINENTLMIDLIQALQMPTLIVARTVLGTLNHTLLTIEALRAREIPIAGLILVGEAHPSNAETLKTRGQVEILGHVPPCPSFSRSWFDDVFQNFSPSLRTLRRSYDAEL